MIKMFTKKETIIALKHLKDKTSVYKSTLRCHFFSLTSLAEIKKS